MSSVDDLLVPWRVSNNDALVPLCDAYCIMKHALVCVAGKRGDQGVEIREREQQGKTTDQKPRNS